MADDLKVVALKELDSASLAVGIQMAVAEWAAAELVHRAVADAAALHRAQARGVRAGFPRTSYIEHPYRNTLRLLRWGLTDVDVAVAALLHDVVEDASEIISARLGQPEASQDGARSLTLQWMADRYGPVPAEIVAAVTNPISPASASRIDREVAYTQHFAAAVAGDARALAVKWTDVVDNAASLHHTAADPKTANRASKYLRLFGPLQETISAQWSELSMLLPDLGRGECDEILSNTRARLENLTR